MASRTQKVLDGGGGGDGKKARPGRGGEEHKKRASERAGVWTEYIQEPRDALFLPHHGRKGGTEGETEGDMD